MNKFLKTFWGLAGLLAAGAASAAGASVDSVGGAAENVASNLPAVLDVMTAFAYIFAVWAGLKALQLLLAHGSGHHRHGGGSLFPVVGWLIAMTLLFALPGFVEMTASSMGLQSGALPDFGLSSTTPGQDLATMAISLSGSMPGLKKLIAGFAAVAGAFLLIRAALLTPLVSEGRLPPGRVGWMAVSGALLWCVPQFLDLASGTMGMGRTSNILAAGFAESLGISPAGSGDFGQTVVAIFTILQVVGFVAVVRGGLMLKTLGEAGESHFGKAMTHIFAGSACANMPLVVKILSTSIGANAVICGGQLAVLCGG